MFHSDALSLLWRVLLCLVLTFLPCFAVCALAIHKGATRVIWLYFLALAEIGAAGWLAFWCWFAVPWLGHLFSFCLPIGSAVYLGVILRRFNPEQRKLLSALLWPTALTAAAALIVLSAGFLYGGLETPFITAADRFSHPLPADNQLPYLLAKAMQHARPPIPFFGDWLSSDRPPLQTGISLSEFAYIRRSPMHQILSTISQSLWIFALYPFLCALRIEFRAIRLALVVCLFSGFVLVNSFFCLAEADRGRLHAGVQCVAVVSTTMERNEGQQRQSGAWGCASRLRNAFARRRCVLYYRPVFHCSTPSLSHYFS
jgi:hypothetical protein